MNINEGNLFPFHCFSSLFISRRKLSVIKKGNAIIYFYFTENVEEILNVSLNYSFKAHRAISDESCITFIARLLKWEKKVHIAFYLTIYVWPICILIYFIVHLPANSKQFNINWEVMTFISLLLQMYGGHKKLTELNCVI